MANQAEDEALYNQQKNWEKEQEFYASESAKAEANIRAQEESEMAVANQAIEKVREGIAKTIYEDWSVRGIEWNKLFDEEKEPWLKTADKILADPDILIKNPDQSLPEIPRKDIVHIIVERDRILLQAHWVKVIKEEEK